MKHPWQPMHYETTHRTSWLDRNWNRVCVWIMVAVVVLGWAVL